MPDKATHATGRVELTAAKTRLSIKFPYDPGVLNKVKSLSDRRWHSTDKRWTADLSVPNVEKLRDWGFTMDAEVSRFILARVAPVPTVDLSGVQLRGELYPFQREGVERLMSMQGRALLGDEQGLGKTVQALAWLDLNPQARPAVIVCPASLKLNWKREAERWLHEDEDITVVEGTTGRKIPGSIIIINYDILAKRRDDLPKIIKAVILDEAHAIKSRSTQRTKAVQALCKPVQHVIALTGTPILNRPVELFNTVNIVAPGVFPSFWHFAQKFCGAKHTRFGWDFTGASNIPELSELLHRTVMIRRLKADVMKDLPPKQYSYVPMALDDPARYKAAEADFIAWLRSEGEIEKAKRASRAETLSRIEGLKQVAALSKLPAAIEWIADFLESGKKLVVMATHKAVLNALEQAFPSVSVRLDGSTSAGDRQAVVDSFQNNPAIKLFLGNIQAAGVGITLTAADSLVMLEAPWTPALCSQAEDRIHRIGQAAESVNIYYLLAAGTIEEDIASMLVRKAKVLAAVLDGAPDDETSMLGEILQKFGGRV